MSDTFAARNDAGTDKLFFSNPSSISSFNGEFLAKTWRMKAELDLQCSSFTSYIYNAIT